MGLTVVVGVDGSDCSQRALETVTGLARHMPDTRVILVRCYEMHTGILPSGITSSALVMTGELEEQTHAVGEATRLLDQAKDGLERVGVRAETLVCTTGAVQALLQAVEDFEADMIAIGSHGEGALSGAIMGSTAYRILHRSTVPVLVVPLQHD